jgi:hypothetical protein
MVLPMVEKASGELELGVVGRTVVVVVDATVVVVDATVVVVVGARVVVAVVVVVVVGARVVVVVVVDGAIVVVVVDTPSSLFVPRAAFSARMALWRAAGIPERLRSSSQYHQK